MTNEFYQDVKEAVNQIEREKRKQEYDMFYNMIVEALNDYVPCVVPLSLLCELTGLNRGRLKYAIKFLWRDRLVVLEYKYDWYIQLKENCFIEEIL